MVRTQPAIVQKDPKSSAVEPVSKIPFHEVSYLSGLLDVPPLYVTLLDWTPLVEQRSPKAFLDDGGR
ncbi:hypothetical protein [Paenarthrobacter nitroguajacolicus]|uniref:hypothetical protein n=1 Tax=Paenarthrobacter nitroguajacolicus TaxID=211146 RepID=UPI000B807136|nr:hypothetical protein [Paenarthrobacter nitroguajacolicus]